MKILIVDDSIVFRSQIKAALTAMPQVEVVGSAANGKIALARLQQSPVDLITLDLEMPEMNGLETLKEIRRLGLKVRVIMFSSLTVRGGESALEALRLGADDVVAKPTANNVSLEKAAESVAEQLIPRVRQFLYKQQNEAEKKMTFSDVAVPIKSPTTPGNWSKKSLRFFKPSVVVIGCSTGGPKILEEIFTGIKGPLRVPVLIVQHMPPVFTKCLADRISMITGIPSGEGKHMEKLEKKIYVAPGDFHMSLLREGSSMFVQLDQGLPQNMVRPAVDPLFQTAANYYGRDCMSFILTGMGEDGLRGTKAIKEAGGGVMIQNKESCIVFGMPGAVYRENCFDEIGSPAEIRALLKEMIEEKSI